MATLQEARDALNQRLSIYRQSRPTRLAFLGDGRGYAASNMFVPQEPNTTYARGALDDSNFFTVVNVSARPMHNLPVVLGYTEDDPKTEQVLHTYTEIMGGAGAGGSLLSGFDKHHYQHEFGGGDEVFVDSRLFMPGLVHPTKPPSMQLTVLRFIYYYDKWRQFGGANTIDLTTYIPATKARYLLIALEPSINELVYIPGPIEQVTLTWSDYLEGIDDYSECDDLVPGAAGNQIPVAFLRIDADMTVLDYTWADNTVIFDARLHLGHPQHEVLDRIDSLERSNGNNITLPTTLVASGTTEENFTVDGGLF
jgi:hypothetical protein